MGRNPAAGPRAGRTGHKLQLTEKNASHTHSHTGVVVDVFNGLTEGQLLLNFLPREPTIHIHCYSVARWRVWRCEGAQYEPPGAQDTAGRDMARVTSCGVRVVHCTRQMGDTAVRTVPLVDPR